jgi:hypothetical protein
MPLAAAFTDGASGYKLIGGSELPLERDKSVGRDVEVEKGMT